MLTAFGKPFDVKIIEMGASDFHGLQEEHGGRKSLCVTCQVKIGQFVWDGFFYCPEHCKCPNCKERKT